MKQLALAILLTLVSLGALSDFTCPDGTEPACLANSDKVCPGASKCVDFGATCFDDYPCDSRGGFVCASSYDDTLNNYKEAVSQHDQLASENVGLRETRLEQKNCVLNASSLETAQNCVR
jgi:hypothetical protein